jgi:hypothetical protein
MPEDFENKIQISDLEARPIKKKELRRIYLLKVRRFGN